MDATVDLGMGDDSMDGELPALDDTGDPDNLIPSIESTDEGKRWLKKRTANVVRLIKQDVESKKDWMDMREEQIKLFAGLVPRMGYPASGGRAPHDPIVCRTILQMWTRGCDQITPSKGNLIQVQPVGEEDEAIAQRREKHMNWQLRHKVPNYVPGVRESYLQYLMSGSTFREHYFDPVIGATRFDHLTADDITVSYTLKDVDPLMRRVPRVTRHLRFYRWELEQREEAGEFPAGTVEKLYAKGKGGLSGGTEESGLEKQAQVIDGVVNPQTTVSVNEDGDDSGLRELYRCYLWMKLPESKRSQAVTLVIDAATGLPLSLKIREEEDPFDKVRFEQETRVFELEMQNTKAQYQAALSGWSQPGPMGEPPPQAMGAPEPPMPEDPPPPAPVKMIPAFNVIHYRLFPNPHGFYGIGVAYLLTNANELVNQLEAEYLLAARFANLKQGFLSKGAVPKSGELRAEMGKFIQTNLEPGEMNGIHEFSFSPPSEGLRKVIDGMKQDAYSLVADIDTLTGQAGPTNETKAAAEQRQANATTLMTAVASLWLETFALEPKMLAKDNGKYMDEHETYWVTEPSKEQPETPGQPPQEKRVQATAHRDDYANEFDFTMTADQRMQTQPERVQTATNLITSLNNGPYAKDPTRGPPLYWAAYARLFRALDLMEMEKALGPAPPAPQPPPPPKPPVPMSQVQENQMFLQEQDHPVLPDDNHEEHLMVIDDFKNSPFEAQMTSTGKQIRDRHQRAHEAALYGQEANQGDQNGNDQRMGNGPGRGTGGVPGGPDVPGPPVGGPPPPGAGNGTPAGGVPGIQ